LYDSATNTFTAIGLPTIPPTEEFVSSFELLPNRSLSQVCLISEAKPIFAITNNRVTCKFVITSESSKVPNQGLVATFLESVDCTGAMTNTGTRCDGCNVCKGNGSTCNADCDTAVASGRKYDDCQLCGGSTFFYPDRIDGLAYQNAIDNADDDSQTLGSVLFQQKYCPGVIFVISFLHLFISITLQPLASSPTRLIQTTK
jgi:hypothetical protein